MPEKELLFLSAMIFFGLIAIVMTFMLVAKGKDLSQMESELIKNSVIKDLLNQIILSEREILGLTGIPQSVLPQLIEKLTKFLQIYGDVLDQHQIEVGFHRDFLLMLLALAYKTRNELTKYGQIRMQVKERIGEGQTQIIETELSALFNN